MRHLLASVRHGWRLFALGLALTLAGALLAHFVQTAGGIRVTDIRFKGADGSTMGALLYVPPGVTATTPAPGILAVHGYINSRETQSGFAIEYARRGYVVLALDQRGHGYSAPPAFAAGFGGPDGLNYLRSFDIVDRNNIGLEGHSMGGWTVLAAAATFPDAYRSMVIEGSSTGAPFAVEGTSVFPRNVAVVYSRYDEFSQLMWGIRSARDIAASPKLLALFGTSAPVEEGRIYGSIENGTARVLYSPSVTHAMDHISPEAIGDSIDWFQQTLAGGKPLPADDQIWIWKEIGTLIAFIGFVVLLLGTFGWLLALPWFAPLVAVPAMTAGRRDARWWISLVLGALLPALTLLPFFQFAEAAAPASRLFPQSLTNQIAVWAMLNGLLIFALSFVPGGGRPRFNSQIGRSIAIALLTVAVGYAGARGLRCPVHRGLPLLGAGAETAGPIAMGGIPRVSRPICDLLPAGAAGTASRHHARDVATRHPVPDQCGGPGGRLHPVRENPVWPVVRDRQHEGVFRKRRAADHHGRPVHTAPLHRRDHFDIHVPAHEQLPAGRVHLRPVRDLVCRCGPGNPRGRLTDRRQAP